LQVLQDASGQDITKLFEGSMEGGHAHSRAAASLLGRYCVGELAEPDDASAAPHRRAGAEPSASGAGAAVIDESKPLLWQVGRLGPGYMDWVHSPSPGQPRFFHSAWAERATKVRWWVVPLLWGPVVAWSLARALHHGLGNAAAAVLLVAGVIAWQLLEYLLHRFAFHTTPATPAAIFMHFLLHGCHHKYPMDVERLVFPPLPASWVAAAIHVAVHAALPPAPAAAAFAGIILGYVAYDCMHYLMHAGALGGPMREAHMRHHYRDPRSGFGISSPLFDWALGTAPGGAQGGARRAAALVRG
jgi:dihydroceramide fatty acyl 2-hydroxylase